MNRSLICCGAGPTTGSGTPRLQALIRKRVMIPPHANNAPTMRKLTAPKPLITLPRDAMSVHETNRSGLYTGAPSASGSTISGAQDRP
jgi:hypothetical protein